MTEAFVYFMRPEGMEGPIKIGCSTVPARRLEELSVWSPYPLEIAAIVPGDYDIERKLHNRFAFAHLHREWFRAVPELTEAVASIAGGAPIESAVDLSIETGLIRQRGKGTRPQPAYRDGYRSYSSRVTWTERKLRRGNENGRWHAPDDVEQIINRWNGDPYHGRPGVRPTEDEFRRLDEYLADPAAHSVTCSWMKVAA